MISAKRLSILALTIIIPLTGCQALARSVHSPLEQVDNAEETAADPWGIDPVMNLLGQSFDDIEQALGEPDEQGYDEWLGPHYYILYHHEKGVIRFGSPESMENRTAVSIILGPGQEVLGAKVGMHFAEIKDVLGPPDFGPDLSIDNLYHMGYFIGEMNDQVPEIFISFSASRLDGPTKDAFIKWEAFEAHGTSVGVNCGPH